MNCVSSSDLSLKYKRFTPLGCQDISIRKFEFVTKTQFLSLEGDYSFGVQYRFNTYSLYLYCTAYPAWLKFGPVHVKKRNVHVQLCVRNRII